MIRKATLFFLCIISLFSCQKEIISIWLFEGRWNIRELYVKKDFSGKKSEYTVSNAGTFTFSKKEEGNLREAQDSTFSNDDFNWVMKDKTISITYKTKNNIETWTITKDENNRKELECTQSIIHESGGLSTKEVRYRKITLEK